LLSRYNALINVGGF